MLEDDNGNPGSFDHDLTCNLTHDQTQLSPDTGGVEPSETNVTHQGVIHMHFASRVRTYVGIKANY